MHSRQDRDQNGLDFKGEDVRYSSFFLLYPSLLSVKRESLVSIFKIRDPDRYLVNRKASQTTHPSQRGISSIDNLANRIDLTTGILRILGQNIIGCISVILKIKIALLGGV